MSGLFAIISVMVGAAPSERVAIKTLATDVVRQAQTMNPEAPVGIFVEGAAPELNRAFASLMAAELGSLRLAPVIVDSATADAAERAARSHGVRSLIRANVSLVEGKLTARGDAFSTWVNFWSGSVPTRSGTAAVIASQVEADPDTLLLAGVAAPTAPTSAAALELKVSSLARFQGVPAGLTVGDLDGDQHPEVALVIDDELWVYSAEGKVLAHAALTGALSTHPTREPFAVLSILAGKLTVLSARHEKPELFTFAGGALRSKGPTEEFTLDAMSLQLRPGLTRLVKDFAWAGKPMKFPDDFQNAATRKTLTFVHFGDATAALTRGTPPGTRISGIGSGSALADFDGDDVPELLATDPHTTGSNDEWKLFTLSSVEAAQGRSASLGDVTPVWRQPWTHGRAVMAVAADLDGKPGEEVLAATVTGDGGELVLLQRVIR